jgi:hypothetical protein
MPKPIKLGRAKPSRDSEFVLMQWQAPSSFGAGENSFLAFAVPKEFLSRVRTPPHGEKVLASLKCDQLFSARDVRTYENFLAAMFGPVASGDGPGREQLAVA